MIKEVFVFFKFPHKREFFHMEVGHWFNVFVAPPTNKLFLTAKTQVTIFEFLVTHMGTDWSLDGDVLIVSNFNIRGARVTHLPTSCLLAKFALSGCNLYEPFALTSCTTISWSNFVRSSHRNCNNYQNETNDIVTI